MCKSQRSRTGCPKQPWPASLPLVLRNLPHPRPYSPETASLLMTFVVRLIRCLKLGGRAQGHGHVECRQAAELGRAEPTSGWWDGGVTQLLAPRWGQRSHSPTVCVSTVEDIKLQPSLEHLRCRRRGVLQSRLSEPSFPCRPAPGRGGSMRGSAWPPAGMAAAVQGPPGFQAGAYGSAGVTGCRLLPSKRQTPLI